MDRSPGGFWEAFLAALETVGLANSFQTSPTKSAPWDAVGSIEGVPVAVEVKVAPGMGDVLAVADRETADGRYKVLVGGRISAATREALAERGIGFFDARGHVRLWCRPLLVDTDVPMPVTPPTKAGPPRFDTGSMLDVALAVLDGTAAAGVRPTADATGRAPGTVSKQLSALRSIYLVDDANRPTVPDLFEVVLQAWHPVRLPLAGRPGPGAGAVNQRLRLGLEDLTAPGWVLADAFAAAAWGAPVVLSGTAPPDYYLPDAQALSQARALLGEASLGSHDCTVAVAPAPSICRRRFDRGRRFDDPFPAPSPIVAALDLASDPARGRELLETWSRDLPPELPRVW